LLIACSDKKVKVLHDSDVKDRWKKFILFEKSTEYTVEEHRIFCCSLDSVESKSKSGNLEDILGSDPYS
jgi:hypothetical protein